MTVTIRYCRSWGYKPRAARVAAELEKALGVKAELVVGSPGEFTVWVGDTLVAEKQSSHFPEPDDVVEDVREALAAAAP